MPPIGFRGCDTRPGRVRVVKANLTHDQQRLKRLFFSSSLAIYRHGEGLDGLMPTIGTLQSGMTAEEYVAAFHSYWDSHRRSYSDWYAAGVDSQHLYDVMWRWAMTLEPRDPQVLHTVGS